MQRATALKKLAQIIGKDFAYRTSDKAPTPEEREAAKIALPAAQAERARLKELKEARMNAILAADAEYQKLVEDVKAASNKASDLSGMLHHYKITVGKVVMGLMFSVMAEGDTWEEVLDKVTRKQPA